MTVIVAESISSGKPVSLDTMGAAQRLRVVAAAVNRPPGVTLAEIRLPVGVGRTWLFEAQRRARQAIMPRPPGPDPRINELRNLREQVNRLQTENAELKAVLDDAARRAARSVEVTPERVWGTTAELAVSPVSTRNMHTILVKAFGSKHAPADNTIARRINALGHLAGTILDECGAMERFEQAAIDEIFFHQTPVLAAVEPRSTAIGILHRAERRDAKTWKQQLQRLENLRRAASDLGSGIQAALRQCGIQGQADTFHAWREWHRAEAPLDKWVYECLKEEDKITKRFRKKNCRGPKPHESLRLARMMTDWALEDFEHFLAAKDLFAIAVSPFSKNHQLATFASQVALLSRAIDHLDAISKKSNKLKKLRTYLFRNKASLVAFTRVLWNIQATLKPSANPWWNARRVISAAAWPLGLCAAIEKEANPDERRRLCALLPRAYARRAEAMSQCDSFHLVEAQLKDRLDNLERASSAVENINSKLRPVQAIKKTVNQAFLNLFALKHNLTPFERSAKRKGKSPYEILGIKLEGDEQGWLGVLMARAKNDGLIPA